jgi:hypothetical protein
MQNGTETTLTTVPVRLNVNLKAETLDQLENKKKNWHMTSFQYRIDELRNQLKDMALVGNAAARLHKDGSQGATITVEQLIENLLTKVQAVKIRHGEVNVRDYANESLYRSLVSDSLDACRYARSILQLWLDDTSKRIEWCGDYPLLFGHRLLVSYLKLKIATSKTDDEITKHAKALCKVRLSHVCLPIPTPTNTNAPQTNNIACLPSVWLVRKCVCYIELHCSNNVLHALFTAFCAFGSAIFDSFGFADRFSCLNLPYFSIHFSLLCTRLVLHFDHSAGARPDVQRRSQRTQ